MTILDKILEIKKEEVAILHQKYSRSSFSESELFHKERIDFASALKNGNRISVIAEIKKASPSKGILKEDFNHLSIAEIYMSGKVDAISVLTDQQFFKGNISFLKDIAEIKTVPLLRKDFIIDEFQILEAKANGADSILLIAEALSKNQIDELTSTAVENDLDVLLEIHSESQLSKINFSKNKIIGINNRDLSTFQVDMNTTIHLSNQIPDECLIVSESGINSQRDVDILKNYADAFLVGEHFMKSENITIALNEFLEWCKK
jgi:indole-3-glycerol phosphate synthase